MGKLYGFIFRTMLSSYFCRYSDLRSTYLTNVSSIILSTLSILLDNGHITTMIVRVFIFHVTHVSDSFNRLKVSITRLALTQNAAEALINGF